MRNLFPAYYPVSPEDLEELWREARFVVDANVLLNLYRHSPETRDDLIALLEQLKERLWIPYQFALEFHRNREKVILSQVEAYKKIEETFQTTIRNFTGKRHPFASTASQEALGTVCADLEGRRKEVRRLLAADPYLPKIAQLLHERVGQRPTEVEIAEFRRVADERFARKTPPGYEDVKAKDDPQGDYIAWAQILAASKAHRGPVVLITDDAKGDWWRVANGETLGPRVELIEEFQTTCGAMFHMYSTDSFMSNAKKVGLTVREETIKEVAQLREAQILEAADYKRDASLQGVKPMSPVIGAHGTPKAQALDVPDGEPSAAKPADIGQGDATIEPSDPAPTKSRG